MDREEFSSWGEDLKRKLPELGDYVWSLPREVRDEWFDGIFANFDLVDAIAMNSEIMTTAEGTERYKRDELPKLWIRKLADIRYAREQMALQPRSHTEWRPRCFDCEDSGYVGKMERGQYTVYCCHCELGEKRHQPWRSGRIVGRLTKGAFE